MSADYVAESAETLAEALLAAGVDRGYIHIARRLLASGAVRPAAEVRAEVLLPVRALAEKWKAFDPAGNWRAHLTSDFRAALAEEDGDRGCVVVDGVCPRHTANNPDCTVYNERGLQ